MQLKVLTVPFFLVMILILSIGFIKPDFDEIMARKSSIVTQDNLIANIDSTINNTVTLSNSLNKEKESEIFLLSYLPFAMNQDETIAMFNYLASQSGLIVSDMDLKKSVETPNVNIAPDGSVIEDTKVSEVKTFQFTGSVLGSYENIKAFFNRLVYVNRFQNVRLFSLQKNIQVSGNATDLKGTFVVDYGYLPIKSVPSALNMPVFLNAELNFSEVAALQAKMTNVPSLEKGTPGKPNPFQ